MKNFISIPTPCHENWDTMTPAEQGKHCSKCNIVVKDFTQMSNEEILAYLNTQKRPKCIKMNSEQLIGIPNLSQKAKRFLYALAACFLPFTSITTASLFIPTETNAQANAGGLEGKVFNSKGEAIPFAIVIAEQNGIQKKVSKSDINGNYKLKPLAPGSYTLKISRLGYSPLEIINVAIKADAIIERSIILNKPAGGIKLGSPHIIGSYTAPSNIDKFEPNKQEISGDQVRDLFGG